MAAGAAATPAAAQSSGGLSEWFSNTDNYDGVVDETGADEVTVEVGAEANGGAYGFAPAAVRVDPGTTVTWEWTGAGGSHNVVETDGAFESELVGEEGHAFEHTVESEGVFRYSCTPHGTLGMKGAVVVGDVEVDGGGESGSETESGGGAATASATESSDGAAGGGSGGDGGAGDAPAWLLLGGGVGAALSPLVFGLLLVLFGGDDEPERPGYRTDGGTRVPDADDGGR